LSIETTTGMSAPPIGMINRTPMANARSVIRMKAQPLSPATNQARIRRMAMPMPALMTCLAGSMIGLLLITVATGPFKGPSAFSTLGGSWPCSLPKAMTEPVKVIAPMIVPRPISKSESSLMPPSGLTRPKSTGLMKAAAATSTAAMPTREWKPATSCGIAVISIFCAIV
jgi:hypothetical protein